MKIFTKINKAYQEETKFKGKKEMKHETIYLFITDNLD